MDIWIRPGCHLPEPEVGEPSMTAPELSRSGTGRLSGGDWQAKAPAPQLAQSLPYFRECVRHFSIVLFCCLLASCGYHVAGQADLVPKSIHTIAIPAFSNLTTRYKLTDHLPQAISHEFIARTRYQIVTDPQAADAVLRGSVINYIAYPTTIDQQTSRASGLQVSVTMQISLVERATGKVIFTRPSFDVHQRYEVSLNAGAYFEESDAALDRLSRDVARDVVTAILENF